jgi:phosphoglucosamine mutase
MVASDLMLGGEQSGHVIFREFATTGDGLLTCLRVLEAMQETGKSLHELTSGLATFPQKLVNIKVRERRPFTEMDAVQEEIAKAEAYFGDEGRVLVRYSGTELLARVMIEARAIEDVEVYCEKIAAAIRAEIA